MKRTTRKRQSKLTPRQTLTAQFLAAILSNPVMLKQSTSGPPYLMFSTENFNTAVELADKILRIK